MPHRINACIWNKCSFNCRRCKWRCFNFFFSPQCQVSTTDGHSVTFFIGFALKHLDVRLISTTAQADHILCNHTMYFLRFIVPYGSGLRKVRLKSFPIYFQQSRVGDNILVFHIKKNKNHCLKTFPYIYVLFLLFTTTTVHLKVHSSTICTLCIYLMLRFFFLFLLCTKSSTVCERQIEVNIFQIAWNQIKVRDRWWRLIYRWAAN